ncbi:MAG: chromosomal replication initiation protein DnaA, partial [Actinobacteria bacterium]|nr:chromosomal replication initiation protein DnaA [Actinomycetota bacterium]
MEEVLELSEVWARSLTHLSDVSLSPQDRAFVSLTKPLAIVEGTVLIASPNEFTKDVLETRLRPVLVRALTEEFGYEIRLAVSVDPSIAPALDDDLTDELADATYATNVQVAEEEVNRPGTGSPASRIDSDSRLSPKYTFDTFVIGSSNRFAHA